MIAAGTHATITLDHNIHVSFFSSFLKQKLQIFFFPKKDPALHHTTEINWIQPSENGKMEIRKM